jgi:hypothetical protein
MDLADIKKLKELDREELRDDLLARVGLAVRRGTAARIFGATAFVVGGVVLGAGLALLLAPKSGKGMREDLSRQLGRLKNGIGGARERVEEALT